MIIRTKPGVFHRLYLIEILRGLFVTINAMLFKKKVTVQYPEERKAYSDRFRGRHYIKTRNGVENCTACMLCATVCPSECIRIEAGERADKEKYPVSFEIDVLRCCFCGMCEEACPSDAIKLSGVYEMSTTFHEIYDKKILLQQRGSK